MPNTLEVIVKPDGSIQIEAVGFQGADCEKATVFLERALGLVKEKRRKPEYYRQARQRQQVGQ